MAQTENQQLLVPLEMYLKAGLHIGTKFRTKFMRQYIYKIRPDGLAVLNVQEVNKGLQQAGEFLAKFEAEKMLVVGKRENSWKAIKMFSKLTGIKYHVGNYNSSIFTNPTLKNFIEPEVILCADPFPDKEVIKKGAQAGATIVALCDTNNEGAHVDVIVPCNNKGRKSLGLSFWILAREYLKGRGLIKGDEDMKAKVEEFIED